MSGIPETIIIILSIILIADDVQQARVCVYLYEASTGKGEKWSCDEIVYNVPYIYLYIYIYILIVGNIIWDLVYIHIYGSGFGTHTGTISYCIMVDTQNIYFGGKIYIARFTVRAYVQWCRWWLSGDTTFFLFFIRYRYTHISRYCITEIGVRNVNDEIFRCTRYGQTTHAAGRARFLA